jgi:hypothetical protein
MATLGGWASLTQTDYEDELFFGVFETFQPPARIGMKSQPHFMGLFASVFQGSACGPRVYLLGCYSDSPARYCPQLATFDFFAGTFQQFLGAFSSFF